MTSGDQVWPAPGLWRSDPAHTYIGFVARHLMVQRLRGRFDVFDVTVHIADPPEDSEVRVELESASVSTGSPDRDVQLRSAHFLDVESFPRLTFESTAVTHKDDGWRVVGDLTVRDRTSPVELAVTFLGVVPDPWGVGRAAFRGFDRDRARAMGPDLEPRRRGRPDGLEEDADRNRLRVGPRHMRVVRQILGSPILVRCRPPYSSSSPRSSR